MSRLGDIPVRVEPFHSETPAPAPWGLCGGVTAILAELITLLERLAESQRPAAIDLRSLPMSPQDRADLKRALGEGEVEATVNAQGRSSVRETRIGGVWWVEHHNQAGELIADLLEVTRVPAILASASDEIAAGARALRKHIGMGARPS